MSFEACPAEATVPPSTLILHDTGPPFAWTVALGTPTLQYSVHVSDFDQDPVADASPDSLPDPRLIDHCTENGVPLVLVTLSTTVRVHDGGGGGGGGGAIGAADEAGAEGCVTTGAVDCDGCGATDVVSVADGVGVLEVLGAPVSADVGEDVSVTVGMALLVLSAKRPSTDAGAPCVDPLVRTA